ncbi:MAG: SDR family NAD(P)-dependent oxidoreductase [Pseudomonadota bacterium]
MHRRQFVTLSAAAATTAALSGCSNSEQKPPDSPKQGFKMSGFGPESTAEQVTLGLDLTGKTALVTGCNSGLGLESMRVLALRGAHVIGSGRTLEKARAACASVPGKTTPVALELSDFASVKRCADEVLALGLPLDILMLNAGISGGEKKRTVNGIELAFLVNYLGHFLLTRRLLPAVERAPEGRVVHVSSRAAYQTAPPEGIRFDTLGEGDGGHEYDVLENYGQSKLANALFSLKLAREYKGSSVTSNSLHPGFVQTGIDRGLTGWRRFLFGAARTVTAKSAEEGAATQCYAATHPAMEGITGQYLVDSNVVQVDVPSHMENTELANQLWEYSEQLVADYLA